MSVKKRAQEVTLNETLSLSNFIVICQRYNMKMNFKNFSTTLAFTYKQKLAKTHCYGTKNSNIAPPNALFNIAQKMENQKFFFLFGSY